MKAVFKGYLKSDIQTEAMNKGKINHRQELQISIRPGKRPLYVYNGVPAVNQYHSE